uniref:Cadherin domain protein n=1 Tax=Globodera pallida TaxID=36090 RepID=A0A183BWM0_GLOPA
MHYWLEGHLSELFKLDPVSGMLCTKKELNVERHGNSIQLKAIAKHSDGSEADAQVIVRLEDVNNHSPVFQPREYALQLSPDMLQPFVPLLRVRAVDMDSSSVSVNSSSSNSSSGTDKIHYRLGDGVGTELFELDEFDGVLMLTERGTRKLGTTEEDGGMMYGLELRVEAADDGGRTSEQLALINVRFVPSRLRCVSFADRIFHFHVSEETLPGIAIGDLRLIDVADADKVLLEIVDDNDSARLFKFDETNAHKLLLETELDSDVAGGEAHLLNVKAIDTAKNCSNLSQILITVLDVNDNAPKFDAKTASIKLPEDFPIHKAFYAVRATDRDRNENGKITYELFQTDPPSVPVQINSNSGILSLSAPLDADSAMFRNNSILLRIRARDHGIPPRHDDMELYMTILDVNDNAPLFDVPEYEIEVPEDAELMSIVHHLNAKDADLTVPNRRVRYSINQILPMIEEGANSSVLGINKWTGEIFLREPLDREQYAQFAFEVEARDGGIPSRMARARLHMRVQDVNDNAPACTQQQIVYVQARGSGGGVQAGDLVGNVQATDPDEGANGTVRFRMQQPNEWFELSAKGDLYFRRPIDAANLSPHARLGADAPAALSLPRSFTLIAEDQSVEMPLSSVCQVLVMMALGQNGTDATEQTVKEVEEASGRHAVRLLGPVQTELWLNAQTPVGTALMQVNASGVQRWSIRPDDPLAQLFAISSDGTIHLAKRPAEGHESFVLAGGTKQSITIQMDPFGNSAPKLLTVVLRRNEYGSGGNFGGSEFPPATITVAEDWSIRWQKPLYTVEKRPKNWTDQMFFRLTAVGDESEKALEMGLFELDELSGALYLAKFPGPNCADEFVFHVMARSLSDQFAFEKDVQLITINLTNWKRNANRRRVRCAKLYQEWNVSESAPIGTFVGRVNILDSANEISTLKFRFNNASSTPAFRVDESDGSLYVRKALDWHTMPTSILLVEVSATTFDEVSQATVTRCAIRVNVQTDAGRTTKSDIRFLSVPNVTIFLANLEQGLYPEGNVVHHFVAISERLPENRALFEIAGGNGLGAFRLESDGALSVPEPSKLAANGGSSVFRLTIRANLNMTTMTSNNNNKMHRNARVEQHFIARVDQSHRKFSYFAKQHFVAEILTDESFAMGRHQFVAKFKRQDNANCALFELVPSPEGFKMNGEDGILEYVAMENGTEALLKAGHNLTLTVLARRCMNSSLDNANYEPAETIDHAVLTIVPRWSIAGPKIEPTSCGNVSVPENEHIRQLLRVRVLLDDDDERVAANGASSSSASSAVVYAIEGGHWHTNLFTIDPGTGWISTGALDREQKQEHLLMVSATDLNSLPKKADMCTVFITVIDRNDNVPVFDPSNAEQIDLSTTASVGHKLAQLEAKDADQGENGQIRYVMASDPSGMFDVGWQTGELTFARESAFISEQSGVWVVLKAVDRGHPKALVSEPKRIRISWERRKSHGNGRSAPPLAFTRQQHAVDVPEGRPRGQFVAQLDLLNRNNSSSPVSYSILPSGNDDFAFSVDAGGKVSTALELDAEIRRHYALQIVAIDASGRQRADTRLDVHVQDANDNAPFIAQQDGAIRLMEDLRRALWFLLFNATDGDASEENSRLSYHLLAGNNFDLFKLDMASGELRFVRWDDAFAMAQIGELSPADELLISARDNGTPCQSAEWSVDVRMDWDGWNGTKPQFGLPIYRKFVPENSALDDKMFSVYADARRVPQHDDNSTDGRRLAQANCTYTIEPTDASSSLSLNETIVVEPTTGDITLIAPLDLETAAANTNMFKGYQQQQQLSIMLHFNVSCTDALGKIVATLPPNVDLNKPIGQVVAIDRDIGYGSAVRYSLDPADAVSAQYVQIAADQGVLGMLRQPSTVGGTTPNGTASGETRVLRFTVWAESGWAYGSEQHRMRSSATVYIEFGEFTTGSNPSMAGADHSLLSSFDLLSLLVLPTLFLCFCLLSVLVLARLLLRSGRSAAKNASGGNFLQPAAPKKRMFSVATCRELQQHAAPDAAGAPALLSPSFESGLFSYVKRTPPMRTERVVDQRHVPSVVPSSCSSSSNYVNMAQHRTASRLAANAAAAATTTAGSRRSAPDSGIDPDARSLASEDSCAVADAFLAALGVVEEMPPRHKGNAKLPPAPQLRHQQTGPPAEDAFLDELIYACMDEIVPVQQQQQQQQLQTARAGARSCSSSSSTFVPHQSTDNIGRTERENVGVGEGKVPNSLKMLAFSFLLTISKRLIEMDAPQKLDPKNGSRV